MKFLHACAKETGENVTNAEVFSASAIFIQKLSTGRVNGKSHFSLANSFRPGLINLVRPTFEFRFGGHKNLRCIKITPLELTIIFILHTCVNDISLKM